MFAWTPTDMLGIDLDFLCHHLSISLGACPISKKKKKIGSREEESSQGRNSEAVASKIHSRSQHRCPGGRDIRLWPSQLHGFIFGYNQIRMHPYDKSKTAFMTDEDNNSDVV
ncbi:hypothetical protein CR513_56952, partial [Mucuna pruriens]